MEVLVLAVVGSPLPGSAQPGDSGSYERERRLQPDFTSGIGIGRITLVGYLLSEPFHEL